MRSGGGGLIRPPCSARRPGDGSNGPGCNRRRTRWRTMQAPHGNIDERRYDTATSTIRAVSWARTNPAAIDGGLRDVTTQAPH